MTRCGDAAETSRRDFRRSRNSPPTIPNCRQNSRATPPTSDEPVLPPQPPPEEPYDLTSYRSVQPAWASTGKASAKVVAAQTNASETRRKRMTELLW
jgi:hypothetical protein